MNIPCLFHHLGVLKIIPGPYNNEIRNSQSFTQLQCNNEHNDSSFALSTACIACHGHYYTHNKALNLFNNPVLVGIILCG